MEKRYQIFISSTFVDLKDERQAALKAILEIDHMPAGMELFPATDDSAWQLIRDVIDSSDYYILIIGGRYGSLDETGLGYTEKEYDYALATKKPVIPLLHENPDNLPRDKTETDNAAWERLKKFRDKVEKKHTCVYWRNADDLKSKVIVGLTAATKRHPAIGWVRADKVPTEATLAEVLSLRNKVAELEQETAALRDQPPAGTEVLAQGNDKFELHLSFVARKSLNAYPFHDDQRYTASITPAWNSIFAAVATSMINEASDLALRQAFNDFLRRESLKAFQSRKEFKDRELREFSFRKDEIETCMVQLRALGLIKENDRKRSIKDTGTYWTLTPYGNTLMVQLRAVRREPVGDEDLGGTAVESQGANES
jgi:nucleoside 2-deoxyribosyltransferase